MAFRASNIIPIDALQQAKSVCNRLKNHASAASAEFASGANATRVIQILGTARKFHAALDAIKSTPGLAAYAKDQENDQNYDVVTEFNAVMAALSDLVTTIVSAFPKDAGDYALAFKFTAAGVVEYRDFTAGQLATIRTKLDAVVGAIS